MGDAVVLKRGGSPGSGVIHVWKEYNLNTSTKYVWDKWSLNSTTTYKWEKYDVASSQIEEYTNTEGSFTVYNASMRGLLGWVSDKSNTALTKTSDNKWCMDHPYGHRTDVNVGSTVPTKPTVINGYHVKDDGTGWMDTRGGKWYNTQLLKMYAGYVVYHDDEGMNYDMVFKYFGYYTISTEYSKGDTSYGQVTSTSSSSYPSNGQSGSYWYVSAGSDTSYSKGSTSYGQVESTSSTAYPNPGNHTDGYWYENRQEVPVYSMGTFKQNVYSTNPNMYPQNGRLGDYWYVYDGTIS